LHGTDLGHAATEQEGASIVTGLTLDEKRRLGRELLQKQQAARTGAGEVSSGSAGGPPAASRLPGYTSQTYDMYLHSNSQEHAESQRFFEWVRAVEEDRAYGFEAARLTPQNPEVRIERQDGVSLQCLNLATYNYLGFASHPAVIAAAKDALDRYGLGCASSPVISGTFLLHKQLEQDLVDFFGVKNRAASLFTSGYGVNSGVVSAFAKQGQHVILDRSAHMSILEGAQLSRATISYFRHNDPQNLERVLSRVAADGTRMLVCVEGVYSADGDFGRLQEIVGVAKKYGAAVLVDEAHSILVAGAKGRGVAYSAGVLEEVDLMVITFSKAFGGVGGAVIAREELIRYINWYAKCRMFSCGLDPAVTGGIRKSLELAQTSEGDERRARVRENADYLRSLLTPRLDIGPSESWIVPVIYGSERLTLPVYDWLQKAGLDTAMMQFPAVAKNEARVRLCVTSEHTHEQLSQAAELLVQAGERFSFAKEKRA
jgi:7-keto-8-aminopelargonate synthetase-like enzyme